MKKIIVGSDGAFFADLSGVRPYSRAALTRPPGCGDCYNAFGRAMPTRQMIQCVPFGVGISG